MSNDELIDFEFSIHELEIRQGHDQLNCFKNS